MSEFEVPRGARGSVARAHDPSCPARVAGVPSVQGPLAAGDVLALQRRAGNRAVGGVLARQARVARPPKPPSAKDRATPENEDMAELIDALEQLDDAALLRRRGEATRQVARPVDAEHKRLLQTLEAIEYVATRRALAPQEPDLKLYNPGRWQDRRTYVRAIVARNVRATGSLEQALALTEQTPGIQPDIDAIKAERDRFAAAFKAQARVTAARMLDAGEQAIADLLRSYGLPVASVEQAAKRLASGAASSLADEVSNVLKRTTGAPGIAQADDAKDVDAPAAVRQRALLHQSVKTLKQRQERVKLLEERSRPMTVRAYPSSHTNPRSQDLELQFAQKAAAKLAAAHEELAAAWIEAERSSPVLTAFRRGTQLDKLDLSALDTDDPHQQMRTVLTRLLPTIVNVGKARTMIQSPGFNPLTLPAVVALTSTNMFVPTGSIRAGVVHDMLADARKDRESLTVTLLGVLLALVTLIPSGGASLLIPVGMASAALATYSAVAIYERREQHKTLADTNVDRARALSQEDPKLTGFAVALVGIGLEGLPLIGAFKRASQLRRLVAAGQEATPTATRLIDELDEIGEARAAPNLGQHALTEARAAQQATAPSPTHQPPATPRRPQEQQHQQQQTKVPDEPDPPAAPAPRATTPAREPPKPPAEHLRKGTVWEYGYRTREEVVQKVMHSLSSFKSGMTDLPGEWSYVLKALKANPGPVNDELLELVPIVMGGLRDPKLYAELMADAWERAARELTDISTALERIARDTGVEIKLVPAGEALEGAGAGLPAGRFFKEHVTQPKYIVDTAPPNALHGRRTHLIQDLVANRALRRAGKTVTAPTFRAKLGLAEGVVHRSQHGTSEIGAFLVGEDSIPMGDYVWRLTYDLFDLQTPALHLPMPEILGFEFHVSFGLK